jgi:Biotin-requiring enzyme
VAEFVFRLPDLAEGLEDAEVVAWRVAEGDLVELNQLLGEMQTSKATVEIPSPCPGRVLRLHARPGDLVRVGEPLVTFDVEGPGVVGRVPGERARMRRVRLRPPGLRAVGLVGRVGPWTNRTFVWMCSSRRSGTAHSYECALPGPQPPIGIASTWPTYWSYGWGGETVIGRGTPGSTGRWCGP